VPPLRLEDVVIGQYARSEGGEADVPGYREEPGVPPDSRTATYAAAVLWVKSPRWRGVPFLLTAGKGLGSRMTEIRLHFREPENDWVRLLQAGAGLRAAPNELVIRVQPEEQIFVQIVKKTPGQTLGLGSVRLDLRYRETYNRARIADAYENLLLDVVRGDRSLFIRDDELEASWDIFTPALRELEERRVAPEPYAFGSSGPAAVDRMAARYGIEDARLSAARADDGQSADGA
jgi:glucose-6-phosphate 1-dehydrogenase